MYMRLIKLLEGICIRKDGESDEDYIQRCGNELTREPDMYNDRETSNIKLQKLMAKKKLPKDMKWNQGFTLEANDGVDEEWMAKKTEEILNKFKETRLRGLTKEDGMPGGAFTGLTSPSGYINGAPKPKDVKKLSKKLHKQREDEDIVNDNEVDRNDVLLNKLTKALIKIKKRGNVLEGDINKPSPKLRPEPHPTRHETEHPPYEKDAMKVKNKFTSPTKK